MNQGSNMKNLIHLLIASSFLAIATIPSQAAEVLMVMWHKETAAEKTFVQNLKKIRPDVSFKYVYGNRNKSTLANELRHININSYDLIHAAGTNTTVMLKTLIKGKKPIVFNLVSDAVGSKIVDSIKKPGNNITGVHFLIKPELQLEILSRIKKVKTLGVWFDPREKHNKVLLKRINAKLKSMGIKYIPIKVIPDAKISEKLLNSAAEKAKTVDANYIIPSYSFYANYKRIFDKIDPSVVTVSSLSTVARAGATIAIASDIGERSNVLAGYADNILKGKNAGDIPISLVTKKNAFLFVNKKRADAAGIKNLEKLGLSIKYIGQ